MKRWGKPETAFVIWVGAALALLVPVTIFLHASFPIFTLLWLIVPLGMVIRRKDAGAAGFLAISWRKFLSTAAIALAGLILLSILFEPWSHAYTSLVQAALKGTPPDTTFAWLLRFPGLPGWLGLLLFSGLVSIFGEELFFRGWLLHALQGRLGGVWAVVLQAVLFTLPQLLAALLLPPLQGAVYAAAYSFIGVGLVGGWAARRTQSIWPSLAAAVLWNLLMTAWSMMGV